MEPLQPDVHLVAHPVGLGLAGEMGEGADLAKQHLFQSHVIDRARLLDELGDVLWYSMLICHTLDFSLKT